MSHEITTDYLRAALVEIEKAEGPFKRDPLAFAESVIASQQKIAHDALNGEWDPPETVVRESSGGVSATPEGANP